MMNTNLLMPLSESELDELNELLFKYISEEDNDYLYSIATLTELDGYFTAILSSPVMIPVNQWLPSLWNNSPPEWKDIDEFNHFNSLVMRYYNEVNTALKMGRKYYCAQFEVRLIDEEEWVITGDWSYAYMIGRKLFKMPELPSDIQAALDLIEEDGSIGKNEEEIFSASPTTAQETVKKARKIENAVLRIYEYVDKYIYKPSLMKAKNKIGINSPCPCGSGKKYKKCCLHKR
nr:UPF0149 family protein [uncultured Haemophilus sp.]